MAGDIQKGAFLAPFNLLQAIKILLNLGEYLPRLACAKSLNQPLFSIFVAFAIVAAAITTAQRNDIFRCIAATFSNRYPVILGQNMEQSWWSATNSTAIIPVLEALSPIVSSETTYCGFLTRTSAMFSYSCFITVKCVINLMFGAYSVFIGVVILPTVCVASNFGLLIPTSSILFSLYVCPLFSEYFIPVLAVISPTIFAASFRICLSVFSLTPLKFLLVYSVKSSLNPPILFRISTVSFTMFLIQSGFVTFPILMRSDFLCSLVLLCVFLAIPLSSSFRTLSTNRPQPHSSISLFILKEYNRIREICAASFTRLIQEGKVKHKAPQLCWLNTMDVVRTVLSAVFSGATLDYSPNCTSFSAVLLESEELA